MLPVKLGRRPALTEPRPNINLWSSSDCSRDDYLGIKGEPVRANPQSLLENLCLALLSPPSSQNPMVYSGRKENHRHDYSFRFVIYWEEQAKAFSSRRTVPSQRMVKSEKKRKEKARAQEWSAAISRKFYNFIKKLLEHRWRSSMGFTFAEFIWYDYFPSLLLFYVKQSTYAMVNPVNIVHRPIPESERAKLCRGNKSISMLAPLPVINLAKLRDRFRC